MVGLSWLKYLGLGSKKTTKKMERKLVRDLRPLAPRQILMIGLGDGQEALEVIEVAKQAHPQEPIGFTGLDLFEAANCSDMQLSLRDAYRVLRGTGAEVRLIPGAPQLSLPAYANHVQGLDVAIITWPVDQSEETLWKYLPRMLAANATVFFRLESAAGNTVTEPEVAGDEQWRRYAAGSLPQVRSSRNAAGRRAA